MFGKKTIVRVKSKLNLRKAEAEEKANLRLQKIHRDIPEIKEIDEAFPKIASKLVVTVTNRLSKEQIDKIIEDLKNESAELEDARRECLKSYGYPPDYTEPHYFCAKCGDTGYVNGKMCDCMKRECILLGYENSGLGTLLAKQSFDNFSLDFYKGNDRERMEYNLYMCKKYVEDFGKSGSSLLFIGATGLGKTHLSTAVAKELIEKGFDVRYETSQNILSKYCNERFGRNYGNDDGKDEGTEAYFDCDLLIVDDFGTEENNQLSVSVFYNLINTRINKGLPIIINTNLKENEIRMRYADRITSRLFGEFTVLAFPGKDIRMQNLLR